MKIIHLKPKQARLTDINLIAACLRGGEVLVLPTDTIYGLSCLISNKKSARRIFSLKKGKQASR